MQRSDETLFDALAIEVEQRLSGFNLQDLTNTAYAFGNVNLSGKRLLMPMAREAERRLSELSA